MDTIRPCFALFPVLGTNKLLLLSQGQKNTHKDKPSRSAKLFLHSGFCLTFESESLEVPFVETRFRAQADFSEN